MRTIAFVFFIALCGLCTSGAWAQRPGGGCQRGGGTIVPPVATAGFPTIMLSTEGGSMSTAFPPTHQNYSRQAQQMMWRQMQQALLAQQMQQAAAVQQAAVAQREQERQSKIEARKQRRADELAKREAAKARNLARKLAAQR